MLTYIEQYGTPEHIAELLSSKTINEKLSGTPKKCYKYALVAMFINLTSGEHYTTGQELSLIHI